MCRFWSKAIFLFFLTGWPGTGKGTLCGFLAKIPGIICLETSGLLRDYAKAHPESANQILGAMDNGLLVPIEFVKVAVEEGVKAAVDNGHQFIFLDGFPRDEEQARLVSLLRQSLPFNVSFCWINLLLSRDQAEQRIFKRIEEDRLAGRTPRADDIDPVKRKIRLDGHELRARQVDWVLSDLDGSVLAQKIDIDATPAPGVILTECLDILMPLGVGDIPDEVMEEILTS
ncbi:MAG: nucleoside monophosphate kinase [Candidatus Vogelbacteria bacterium]|nr:nucleoside monophosphate kinase [Candidatus Vogelbacteria bacterium]